MGQFVHHAIVVTGHHGNAEAAQKLANDLFPYHVSGLFESAESGFVSFVIGPDGTAENTETSHDGTARRAKYVRWLRQQEELDWAEVRYGDLDHAANGHGAKIMSHSLDGTSLLAMVERQGP